MARRVAKKKARWCGGSGSRPPKEVNVTIAVGVNHKGKVSVSLISPQSNQRGATAAEAGDKVRKWALDDVTADLCHLDPTTVQLHVVSVTLAVPAELAVIEVEGQAAESAPPERVE